MSRRIISRKTNAAIAATTTTDSMMSVSVLRLV